MEVAGDQVSMTYYHPRHKLLGVACGSGQTLMVDAGSMKIKGSENNLKSGVNTCFISRKKYLISGTSNCSYHFQAAEGGLSLPWPLLLTLLLSALFVFLMGSDSLNLEL